jgi:hypothetical protein
LGLRNDQFPEPARITESSRTTPPFLWGSPSRAALLVEGRRVCGKVRHEHIASLGSILVPATIADPVVFWRRLHERLAKLSNRIGVGGKAG